MNEEQSTIFSAPIVHEDKKPKNQKPWKKLLAAFLVVAIVACTTVAVIKLIPEKQDDKDKTVSFNILNIDSDNVEKVEIKTKETQLNLLSTVTVSDDSSSITWSVEGINSAYTDSSSIKSAVTDASVIEASRQVEGSAADYGLVNPKATVTLYARNSAFETVTIKLGNSAPANLGYYCSLSTDNKIYLVDNNIADLTSITPLNFATTKGLAGVLQTESNANCFADGLLTDFDYITVSGKNYTAPLKIEPQDDETLNAYFAFKITSPSIRIGNDDAITNLITVLSSGITSSGAYAYDPDAATLKSYRLDNPDATLTISVAGTPYTILASKVDDSFYAAIDTYGGMIHKIAASSLPFADTKATDYYSSFIVLENLSGLSNFKTAFKDGSSYNFQTVYNSEDESYKAFINGTELDIDNFKAFYRQFISLTPVEQDAKQINDTALTVTLVHSNGSSDTVLTFKPYSNGRYQVEMNGIPMGLITSTSYEKFAANIKNVASGTPIIE